MTDYFAAKARSVFTAASGDPDLSGPLAAWARYAHGVGDSRRGVIVSETGEILAETRHTPATISTPGATYATSGGERVQDRELGLAMAALESRTGRHCIHVKYWQVCTGASRFTPASR